MLSFSLLEERQRENLVRRKQRKRNEVRSENGINNSFEESNGDASISAFSTIQPLQHAILKDMIHLRTKFLEMLPLCLKDNLSTGERTSTNEDSQPTLSPFGCFRHVARTFKLAAFHRFVPTRCDVASFSQLLYATCLDLFLVSDDNDKEDTSQELISEEESIARTTRTMSYQAFAIFSLFLLHETNPLPSAHQVEATSQEHSEILATLPMGLTNRQNPRLLYRRNYRPYIRVEPGIFIRLLQLRHCISGTERDSLRARSLSDRLAADMAHVLDRLWPHFDFVAYIGPMGLHGFSQRQQLRKVATTEERMKTLDWNNIRVSVSCEDQERKGCDDGSNSTNGGMSNSSLKNQMQKYLDRRRCLRIPTSNTKVMKLKRIRQAMASMTFDSRWETKLKSFLGEGDGLDSSIHTSTFQQVSRGVTFVMPATTSPALVEAHNEENHRAESIVNGLSGEMGGLDRDHPSVASHTLVLPSDVAAGMKSALGMLVQTLVNRHEIGFFLGRKRSSQTNQDALAVAGATHEKEGSLTSHDAAASLSLAGADVNSIATASAAGRGALQALIAKAVEQSNEKRKDSSLSVSDFLVGEEEGEKSFQDSRMDGGGKSRHRRSTRLKKSKHSLQDELSDVSSGSENGDEGMSTSGLSSVGRRALDDLFLEVGMMTITTDIPQTTQGVRRKRRLVAPGKSGPGDIPKKRKRGRERSTVNADNKSGESAIAIDDCNRYGGSEGEESDNSSKNDPVSVSGRGQAALQELLHRAFT